MAKINIGRKFELDNETANNRLVLRALDTGQEWYFNEDGTLGNLVDPSSAQQAATKAYADSIAQGLDLKESVDVASTANVDLTSSSDPGAIDGVTLTDGDRILLKDQTTASENGVYVATTAADPSSWERASDVDEDDEVDAGMFVFVERGSVSSDRGYVLVSDDPLVVGTDDLQFSQFSGAGQIVAGNALTKSGDTLAVDEAAISHDLLADISSDDHHTKYTDAEAIAAVAAGITMAANLDMGANAILNLAQINGASLASAPAGDALLSDGNGNLTFGAAGGVEEVSTFGNLPAIDPPQLAYVTGEQEYYYSTPVTGTPFDIASASLSTSINTQDSDSQGIAWNDDGSRLYEVGYGSDKIYQYTVSTPFDITSASFDTDIPSQDGAPFGIAWNDDGSRLYEVGVSSDKIYQYTVSTPFDIASASFSTSINTQSSGPYDIEWNNDGSRLYELDEDSQKIHQYTVSTPFDIGSASLSTSNINLQDNQPQGIAWNDDGSRLYEAGRASDKIYQYTVSTPFDITSASFDTDIPSQDDWPTDIAWNNDGSRLYELSIESNRIYQYTVVSGGWEAF